SKSGGAWLTVGLPGSGLLTAEDPLAPLRNSRRSVRIGGVRMAIVTISHEMGAGGSVIGMALADRLEYR
ncbi:MAG: hypothetical protein ACRELA_12290, partial [Candidatus Rokuibacteriota bacterium]